PQPPPGVHAGSTSWAPILASIGLFVLLYGLVFGGWLLFAGVGVLILSLIYWGREAIRDYDHIEHPPAPPPAPFHAPPPAVHMPGPSFRPLLASIAMAVLFYGLVFGGWLILAGVAMIAISLLGWLADARAEYRGVVV